MKHKFSTQNTEPPAHVLYTLFHEVRHIIRLLLLLLKDITDYL